MGSQNAGGAPRRKKPEEGHVAPGPGLRRAAVVAALEVRGAHRDRDIDVGVGPLEATGGRSPENQGQDGLIRFEGTDEILNRSSVMGLLGLLAGSCDRVSGGGWTLQTELPSALIQSRHMIRGHPMRSPNSVRKISALLLPVIYLGFVSLGLPDGTLGVAWPEIYPDLHLPIGLAGILTLIGTILAAIGGFNSGRIIARFQTGPVILASCALTGAAMLIIAQAPGLGWLLGASVLLGVGAGAVDAGLNGFVAKHYSGRHMNWLHACWGLGAMCGPLLMGWSLDSGPGWRGGYLIIGSMQFALVVLFMATMRLWSTVPERHEPAAGSGTGTGSALLPANSLAGLLSAAIFALYVAVETTTGLWAATVMVVDRGIEPATAAVCAAAYYGAIMGGRVMTGFIVERFGNRPMIRLGGLLALAGAVLFVFAHAVPLAALALLMIGLGFAPIYPCLMHEVPTRFAPDAVQTVIGRQSGAACLGGASIPAIAGLVAQKWLAGVPWLVVAGIVVMIAGIRDLDRRS